IRCYRLETGELPDTLADLMPDYLSEVPEDPFSSSPLIYRRAGDEYVLYSVGKDGIDDGGPPTDSGDESRSDKDFFLRKTPDEG
ncbi:MAG TPA: hypothetical protein VE890_07130, partial [Thermoguttaceae bacterium]|nr:hypothetical protein [Thermoguttaceae bacterium]